SDYGGATQDRKSTSGGCQFLGIHLISWQCKKQSIVATSTTKAEYVAAASCCGQVLWIQNQLLDYGLSVPCETMSKEISTTILRLLQFCDYHNMVAILEKSEHNADFHPIVDFIEASPLRIETTAEGTQILATVDGVLRTVTESSLRINLKLQDEEGISSLPDTELFENLTLMGYNISPNQKFTFQKGEGSEIPTEPHHTSPQEAQPSSPTHISLSSIPTVIPIPTVTQSEPTPLRQYTRRVRIAQSSALPPIADEPASPVRDMCEGEACPTGSSFIANQDRATIAKSSTLPYDTAPRVTSPAAVEGSMQQTINELTSLCTSLQSQHPKLLVQFQAQKVEINKLNVRVKILEENQGVIGARSADDAPIKGRRINEEEGITRRVSSDTEEIRMDEGEVAVERTSEDTEEMATVLTSMDAATVLVGGIDVPTSSDSIPTAGPLVVDIHTGSDAVPTASPIIATTTVVTPYSRRKGKKVMVESDTPKKQRLLEMQKWQGFMMKKSFKVKDFKGITFEEIEAKFAAVWKLVEDFIPMGSKEEVERLKRKGFNLKQEKAKKQMTSEELVPIEEVYVQALQVKHPIIDLKVHIEDREDLNQLWVLVKEYLSIRPASSDKEMKLWVELKRLYEPDPEDQLWAQTQNYMHAPIEWKLYDLSGVHHVTTKDKEIFMLVEKDYPLRKGLALMMICYKLQVEIFSQMANDLVLKIYKIANSPRQQGD
nr:ribonuclease H-like domain, reverse transcriptase, RNA-dependent DNA polymerase [Tanacetum cinerariifolium]